VGVKIEKACFIGAMFQVCGFDRSPTTRIGESAKTVATSGEPPQRTNQAPVVVNNSGSNEEQTLAADFDYAIFCGNFNDHRFNDPIRSCRTNTKS
jgi:hypothetical protein